LTVSIKNLTSKPNKDKTTKQCRWHLLKSRWSQNVSRWLIVYNNWITQMLVD